MIFVFCLEDKLGKYKFCWYKVCNNAITFWRLEIWDLYYPETYKSVWLQFTLGNLGIIIVKAISTADYLICSVHKNRTVHFCERNETPCLHSGHLIKYDPIDGSGKLETTHQTAGYDSPQGHDPKYSQPWESKLLCQSNNNRS
jgi:predicted cupin superfamily sugar epimerase